LLTATIREAMPIHAIAAVVRVRAMDVGLNMFCLL
jgi:hypothetical protein